MSRAAPPPEYSGDALLLGFSVALIGIGLIGIIDQVFWIERVIQTAALAILLRVRRLPIKN